MQNNDSSLKKILNIFTTTIVVVVVIIAVFLMGARLLGYRVFNVISGSMEPAYSVGDLVYVKEVDVNRIKVGDVITFVLNEDCDIATHRVVGVDKQNQQFITKGDANPNNDPNPIHFKNYIGTPVFAIPYLGYVSNYIQTPPGMYVAIGIGVLLVILVLLPDAVFGKKKNQKTVQGSSDSHEQVFTPNVISDKVDEAENTSVSLDSAEYTSDSGDKQTKEE